MQDTGARRGLGAAEVAAARAQHGPNELPRGPRRSPAAVFLRQFKGFLIFVLIVAAVIAWVIGERIDAFAIGLVVVLNGILGFVQEWRAETALEALRGMLSERARVIRDGVTQDIDARDLVPGDLVLVQAGDKVPADLALSRAVDLALDESVLTGESLPVLREADPEARAWSGTLVVGGRAEGDVIGTGANTEFGRIATMTAGAGEKETHIQRELSRLARQLGFAALGIAALVAVVGLTAGREVVEMAMTALSMAVAVVPEGLPAVVTVTLAIGARAMARRKALARRLQAVETLGAASVICTDKTGTLTENAMTATEIWTGGAVYRVTGTGADPRGHIETGGTVLRAGDDPVLSALLDTAITCNHASLTRDGDTWTAVGEPTEAALVTLAYKGWAPLPEDGARLGEVPFSSERKRMSVLSQRQDQCQLHTKGAPEVVLSVASAILTPDGVQPLDEAGRTTIRDAYAEMAERGLRVLALASREAAPGDLEETQLVLLGLVGLIDPPRPEVPKAVAGAQRAGIRVLMITGDGAVTARAIAGQVGIAASEALTGPEVEAMDDAALDAALARDTVFARTRPAHKLRLVEALQRKGQIVAMTGDGVNDAPALRQADIGISMGRRGTSVARDASDLVLLDDNFATIVGAIREGRRQADNLRKFVRYLLASNAGEVIAILANILIGGPLVFLATQILWINLVTDGVTAVALGLEKAEPGQMRRPPRAPDAPVIGRPGLLAILCFGAYTGTASLLIFYHLLPLGTDLARTAAFTAMVVFEKVSVFAFRSLREPSWRIGWLSNPWLLVALASMLGLQLAAVYFPPMQLLLHTVALRGSDWLLIAAFALPLVAVPELLKTLLYLRNRKNEK